MTDNKDFIEEIFDERPHVRELVEKIEERRRVESKRKKRRTRDKRDRAARKKNR